MAAWLTLRAGINMRGGCRAILIFPAGKLAKLPYNDEWFGIPKPPRTSPATPKIGVLQKEFYARAIQAAGAAVDIRATLKELDNIKVGALPAD